MNEKAVDTCAADERGDECHTHPASIRLALACLALESAILDFLDVEDELEGDALDILSEADHVLFDVRRLRESVEGCAIPADEEEVVRRKRDLLRKLASRLKRETDHIFRQDGRIRLSTEALYYAIAAERRSASVLL